MSGIPMHGEPVEKPKWAQELIDGLPKYSTAVAMSQMDPKDRERIEKEHALVAEMRKTRASEEKELARLRAENAELRKGMVPVGVVEGLVNALIASASESDGWWCSYCGIWAFPDMEDRHTKGCPYIKAKEEIAAAKEGLN